MSNDPADPANPLYASSSDALQVDYAEQHEELEKSRRKRITTHVSFHPLVDISGMVHSDVARPST